MVYSFDTLCFTLIKKVTMKNLVNLKVSSRFARQILYLLIITSLIFLVIILSTKLLRNSSYKSTQTTFNQITKPIQLIDKEQNKTIKQGLPFIYQPSSQTKVLRALLTFYPNDQKDTFESEFRWFYRSWTEMMINESSLWRTDLIVYATIHEELFKNLDCVYNEIRLNAEEKPKCRVFPYIRIKDRESKHETSSKYQTIDKQRSQILFQHLKNYGYIDSINSVYEYNSSYSMYNYILRTDLDCFLTENFAFYVPYDHSLLVGNGGYSTEFNNKRLSRIAHDMNWEYANRSSLGSTWYGPPSMMYHLANYTLYAMLYLAINEFTRPEREQKVGVMVRN